MDFYPDLFSPEALLGSLANAQYIPGNLGADGLFQTEAQPGTTFTVPVDPDDDVSYAANTARGAPSKQLALEKREAYRFDIPSMQPMDVPILADTVLNAGSPDRGRLTVTQLRDRATAKLRRYADLNHEYRRVAVLNSATNTMGSAPAAVQLAFSASDATMRASVHTTVRVAMESALGGLPFTGLVAYCQETYWAALLASKSINETYLNYAAAAELRNEAADQFMYAGVLWKRYRGGGGIDITSGQAKVVPIGVPGGMFVQAFAPDDTMQSVGTAALGQPYYLNAYPLDEDKGVRVKIASHPLMLCLRPTAVLSLKLTG